MLLGDRRKIISLNITEPSAGSDVAAIKCAQLAADICRPELPELELRWSTAWRTTAVREGDFYIVNGNKKWITNGVPGPS